jgi:uncharacterized membrane protein YhiD involved in acid resistance
LDITFFGDGAIGPMVTTTAHYLLILVVAASLGAALGIIRPVRSEIVPRSSHVIQAQILLSIVGAIIIVVVAESLARAFAIVGAAGLVRYRAKIDDPKDAGVMLVALAVGLTTGSGLFGFAILASVFVIGLLWLLESLERPTRARYELTVAGRDLAAVRRDIEGALSNEGVSHILVGSSDHELHYEVTVPYEEQVRKLTAEIQGIDARPDTSVEWRIKRHKSE